MNIIRTFRLFREVARLCLVVILSSLLSFIIAILWFRFPNQFVPAIKWINDYKYALVRIAVGSGLVDVFTGGCISM